MTTEKLTQEQPVTLYPQLVAVCKQAIKECNRYKNGRCSTAFCLMRGGYTGGPVDYSLATCEGHELAQEIERLAAMNDTSWAAQAMEGSND